MRVLITTRASSPSDEYGSFLRGQFWFLWCPPVAIKNVQFLVEHLNANAPCVGAWHSFNGRMHVPSTHLETILVRDSRREMEILMAPLRSIFSPSSISFVSPTNRANIRLHSPAMPARGTGRVCKEVEHFPSDSLGWSSGRLVVDSTRVMLLCSFLCL